MALKYELDSVDELDDGVKALYQKDETSGKYRLGIEGLPQPEDVSGLKNKNQQLLDEVKQFKTKAQQAADEAEKARMEALKNGGDMEAYEKSVQEQREKERAEWQAEKDQLLGTITGMTSGQTATKLAAELSVQGSADVLLPHIERRLKTEYRDTGPVTTVLDKDGKPSAMSIDDLKKEFSENAAFAPLIVGSKASGAGPHGNKGSGAANKNPFSKETLNLTEQARLMKEDPQKAEQLKAQASR